MENEIDSSVSSVVASNIWSKWLKMWNEDPGVAGEIIADDYRLHLPDLTSTIDPGSIRSGADMEGWVRDFSGKFQGLRYTTDFGPLMDGDRFSFRWIGEAHWTGATGWDIDTPGQPVLFVGVDIFTVKDGYITECWSQGSATRTL